MASIALTGCHSLSPYVSPRVAGTVVDARTRQPIEGAGVRRMSARARASRAAEPPKGGELMQEAPGVRTGADGRFVLGSERALTILPKRGWSAVTLTFEHADYRVLTKTFTLADSTNAPSGEPLVLTGDVLLQPLGPTQPVGQLQ